VIKLTNSDKYDKKRIQVAFDFWSEYEKYPRGHFINVIGNEGDVKTEGEVILLENDIIFTPFSQAVLNCLPTKGEKWEIPVEEIKKRRDLRHLAICSVDPPGCRDIDDALHCYELENGNLSVGVHIADVSHFVKPGAPIDIEASKRCTTVYLVDRRTDMLPKLLTETLCSLTSNVDHVAFSVIWEMTKNAEIVNVEYCKSVINPKASLSYEVA